MTPELIAFATAIQQAMAEGAHMIGPNHWLNTVGTYFDAATAAPSTPAPVVNPDPASGQPATVQLLTPTV